MHFQMSFGSVHTLWECNLMLRSFWRHWRYVSWARGAGGAWMGETHEDILSAYFDFLKIVVDEHFLYRLVLSHKAVTASLASQGVMGQSDSSSGNSMIESCELFSSGASKQRRWNWCLPGSVNCKKVLWDVIFYGCFTWKIQIDWRQPL